MKSPITSTALLVFCAVLIPIGVQAQLPGTECNLVLNMTESLTAPGLVLKNELGVPVKPAEPAYENEWSREDANGNIIQENYEYATKATAYKLSNRELLEILVDEGVITEITGWSLKAVLPAFPPDDENDSHPHIYIVRKPVTGPQQTIYIGDYFDFDDHAAAETIKYAAVATYRYDAQGEEIGSSYNETGLISSKIQVDVEFDTSDDDEDVEEIEMDLCGIWNATAQLRKFINGELAEPDFLFVPGNGSLTNISGKLQFSNDVDDYAPSVIEGSMLFSGAKVLPDIGILYPEALPDDD